MRRQRSAEACTGRSDRDVGPGARVPVGFHEVTSNLEKEMAAMMILMVVLLVVGSPGGHMGSHGSNTAPDQTSQSHEQGSAKPDSYKP